MALSSYWNYVTVATKVATDYVGLTYTEPNKTDRGNASSNVSKTLKKSHRIGLYSEMNVECLNFLKDVLNNCRPRLNCQQRANKSCLLLMEKNYILLIEILQYLPFENVINIMVQIESDENAKYDQLKLATDYLLFNDVFGRQYLRQISLNGYSHSMHLKNDRNIIWPYLICTAFELKQYYSLYDEYIGHAQTIKHVLIEKDIDRTLIINYDNEHIEYYGLNNNSFHDVLNEEYKHKLKGILNIYNMLDPQIGYIQGMNYIAANILIALNGNVRNSFSVFCHLMKHDSSPIYIDHGRVSRKGNEFQSYAFCAGGRIAKNGHVGYGLRNLYLPSLPGLIIALLQFEKLIKIYLPFLYSHLIGQGIEVQNFASEWFLSLFCYILPLNISLRVIDIFLIDGWKILHRAGLALLYKARSEILNLGFDKILLLLKRKDLTQHLNLNARTFVKLCMSFKVTNAKLHEGGVHLLTKAINNL